VARFACALLAAIDTVRGDDRRSGPQPRRPTRRVARAAAAPAQHPRSVALSGRGRRHRRRLHCALPAHHAARRSTRVFVDHRPVLDAQYDDDARCRRCRLRERRGAIVHGNRPDVRDTLVSGRPSIRLHPLLLRAMVGDPEGTAAALRPRDRCQCGQPRPATGRQAPAARDSVLRDRAGSNPRLGNAGGRDLGRGWRERRPADL
jgi:hypothetical protein